MFDVSGGLFGSDEDEDEEDDMFSAAPPKAKAAPADAPAPAKTESKPLPKKKTGGLFDDSDEEDEDGDIFGEVASVLSRAHLACLCSDPHLAYMAPTYLLMANGTHMCVVIETNRGVWLHSD